ncbi:hypothetical protein JCM19294_2433 [Nonlabens tegetincola]|uniref:Secretion system C-terminal sorting domain-containing protein n=2 Tax=Nonlabens TaxID=363408 RepID=A0A090QJD6_9FLAO|nr:hypothetical protein JCM19294_2433 [Nonlabens tegetincola]
MLGKEIGQISSGYLMPGTHEFNIKNTLNTRLQEGIYIYKIQAGQDQLSSQFLMK